MIKGYQRPITVEPVETPFQPKAALWAGFLAAIILLIVPSGSPWSGMIFFAPVVLAGLSQPGAALRIVAVWVIHFVVSLLYALVISSVVNRFHRGRAMLSGAVCGAILYAVNLGVVLVVWPNLKGNEVAIAFTHVVFGLITAGAYRGLLNERAHVNPINPPMAP